jgi:hypothetical protein
MRSSLDFRHRLHVFHQSLLHSYWAEGMHRYLIFGILILIEICRHRTLGFVNLIFFHGATLTS